MVPYPGSIHPVTLYTYLTTDFFAGLGFDILFLPEVETAEKNFNQSNVPALHAIRSLHNTFYTIDKTRVLRSHTTSFQDQILRNEFPKPFAKVFIGKVYRKTGKRSRLQMFHQLEGMMVGKNINLAHLKFLLDTFLSKMLKGKRREVYLHKGDEYKYTRFSMDYSYKCLNCEGQQCKLCGYKGSQRLLAGGIIHPNILNNYNQVGFSGISFAIGMERLVCLILGVKDIRSLYL